MSDSPGTGGRLQHLRKVWSVVTLQGRVAAWSVRRSWLDRVFWFLLLVVVVVSIAGRISHSAVVPAVTAGLLVVFILYTAGFLTWQIRSNKRTAASRVQDAVLAQIMWDEEQRLAARGVDSRLPPFALPAGDG